MIFCRYLIYTVPFDRSISVSLSSDGVDPLDSVFAPSRAAPSLVERSKGTFLRKNTWQKVRR